MGLCEKCGIEFQTYCAKCRDEIRQKEMPAVPSDELITLLVYDTKTKLYRYGCSVKSFSLLISKCSQAKHGTFISYLLILQFW